MATDSAGPRGADPPVRPCTGASPPGEHGGKHREGQKGFEKRQVQGLHRIAGILAKALGDACARILRATAIAAFYNMVNRMVAGLGVELEPWDGRMARGPAVERREETIYGNLVGALG